MEGVGRNRMISTLAGLPFAVALLVEGVGRNFIPESAVPLQLESPSSWRAWVEINRPQESDSYSQVALLVEGVGRNQFAVPWELLPLGCLLTEGVDRNMYTL